MIKLPTQYQQYIHLSRYSRWDYTKSRRETWQETVGRYFDFFKTHLKIQCKYSVPSDVIEEIKDAVLSLQIMPSMRCLMTAGEALEKENIAGYNCAYLHIDSPRSFDEILYVLMNGTGVGFSVESKHIEKLPIVPDEMHPTDTLIQVRDSKLGWAKAYRELISLLYVGVIPEWDLSKVRPAGSPLKTFGGRASGPEPLDNLFKFTVESFQKSRGRKLKPIECHDIVCKIAEIVVVGGVRRSALISLSDLGDDQMRTAKSGRWWEEYPQRALANNSSNYHYKPDVGTFLREWTALYESKSGERGIFSSTNAKKKSLELGDRREVRDDYGTNPCSEIILRSQEFCNLSEVVVRSEDKLEDLIRKVKLATILGTWQSTLTKFRYLRNDWKTNCEEERLLGVSLTGIMDNNRLNGVVDAGNLPTLLDSLKKECIKTNKEWSKKLNINPSSAITCVKPSGTVSQLVDSASGIHARHSPYYIRTVRSDINDPLGKYMVEAGVPSEPDITNPSNVLVFSFPIKSPKKSTTRNQLSAVQQLRLWGIYAKYWCEHKPSCTISVKESEWPEVGAFVFDNFDTISGISFLPYSDHTYQQAPYQECSEKEYKDLLKRIPDLEWTTLSDYENIDLTISSQELACTGNTCEIP
jgi:ribonucleoside-diphosphate reductase alpha chain